MLSNSFYRFCLGAFAVTLLCFYSYRADDYYSTLPFDVVDILQRTDHSPNIDIDPLKRFPSLSPNRTHLHTGKHGAVSSDLEVCSKMGVELMRDRGANAADVAVTVGLCIGTINFFNSGVGGGAFTVFKKDNGEATSFDSREQAPMAAHKNMFNKNPERAKIGGLAVAVPGEFKGMYELFHRYGSGNVTWQELIEPVAKIADEGWSVGPVLAAAMYAYRGYFEHLPEWRFMYNETTGEMLKAGDTIYRKNFAKTLRTVAASGSADVFYDPEGPLVGSMVDSIRRKGGIITKDDFSSYAVSVAPALNTTFMGRQVFTCAGSCSGPALVAALNIMDNFDEDIGGDYLPVNAHRLVEGMKWLASARSRLGDGLNMDNMLTKEWAQHAYNSINDSTTMKWQDYNPAYELEEPHGTAHFSIVDPYNNAVAMTTTINLLFGSMVIDPVTGVIFNNEMDDFSIPKTSNAFGLRPSIYKFIEPRKRPLSSTVPTIVMENGRLDFVIGASGGSRITTAVLQALVRTYQYKVPLLETIAFPRVHHQLLPDQVEHEQLIGTDVIDALTNRGHNVVQEQPKSVLNGIRWQGEWHAVSDYWRKRGESAAF